MPLQSTLTHSPLPTRIGRYDIIGVLGRGGMATVYLANSAGEAGFSRLVAIKVLHPHLAEQEDFVAMLLDEARLAARIHHPNVVSVVDLQADGPQHYIVMDYVEGCSFNELLRKNRGTVPPSVVVRIVLDSLNGLHAAHTLTDAAGAPLRLIHRDVTPQNILVGVDGTARLTDFGVALAQSRIHHTRQRELKGKIAFMAPEQARCLPIDHRADIFSVGCLMWLSLTSKSLFLGANDAATLSNILNADIVPPSVINADSPAALDWICVRALEREVDKRWSSAAEMEEALRELAQSNGLIASRKDVAEWVKKTCQHELDERRVAVRDASTVHLDGSMPQKPRAVLSIPQGHAESESLANYASAQHELNANPVNLKMPFWTRSRILLMVAVAAVSAGAGIATLASNSAQQQSPAVTAPPEAVPAAQPRPAEIAAQPSLAPPAPSAPAAKPIAEERPAPPSAPTVKAIDSEPPTVPAAAPHGRVARPAVPRRKAPSTASAVVPERPAPISAPRPTTTTWDKDSPLPPL